MYLLILPNSFFFGPTVALITMYLPQNIDVTVLQNTLTAIEVGYGRGQGQVWWYG